MNTIYSYKVCLLHSKPYKTLKTGIGFMILDRSLKNFKETAFHCVKVMVLGLQLLRATVNLDYLANSSYKNRKFKEWEFAPIRKSA